MRMAPPAAGLYRHVTFRRCGAKIKKARSTISGRHLLHFELPSPALILPQTRKTTFEGKKAISILAQSLL